MSSTTAHRVYDPAAKTGTSKFFEAMGVGFVATVLLATIALLEGAVLMISLSAAHEVWPVIPALGFWATYLLLLGLRILLGTFRQPGKTPTKTA